MPALPDAPPPEDGRPFLARLRAFGCTEVVDLAREAAAPAQIEYVDLIPKRGQAARLPVPVAAVAEHQGTALLYLVDGRRLDSAGRDPGSALAELQQILANRSDPAYLGVLNGGSLDIYPLKLVSLRHKQRRPRALARVEEADPAAPLFFQSLVQGRFGELTAEPPGSDAIYRVIMDLLDGTAAEFGGDPGGEGKIPPLEVLSLAGRALFFRFLVDRGVILPEEAGEICPSVKEIRRAFATAEGAAETSAWLDKTFNGDFLPLIDEGIASTDLAARQAAYLDYYRAVAEKTAGRIFLHLDAVLRGWESVDGRHIQRAFDWSDLDFAHIPVGVLSQVYENFSHRADRQFAKSTSVHYTPRTIARFLVDEAFESLADPAAAIVLDPACGAGIFLVLALRRLVRERWQRDGKPPDAETIRQILYRQIRGFDISESALRLAALGLYITAIELNPSPRPPKSLRFPRNLGDAVLFNFNELKDRPASRGEVPLGSLGPDVPRERFDGRFDLVLGNPPWTPLKDASRELHRSYTDLGRAVLQRRAREAEEENRSELAATLKELAATYENPRKNPDLPFLWRATDWAKPGGILALTLPARLYLLGPKAPSAREPEDEDEAPLGGTDHRALRALLLSLAVTGLIDGSDLRQTAVWQGIKVPFSLLFARNELPTDHHAFRFASPAHELRQNEHGRFRLDYQSDALVTPNEVVAKPWLLKCLAIGNALDVDLVERLLASFPRNLGQFWLEWDDSGGNRTGQGYKLLPRTSQKEAPFLAGLPILEQPEGFLIDYGSLRSFKKTFDQETAHRPRSELLYQPPLVIIPKSPHEYREAAKAFIAREAMAFSQIYYGYSCKGHPQGEVLAELIYLLPHSTMFLYFILMTCPTFGVDRQIFLKQTIDSIPFPDPIQFSTNEKRIASELAHRLETAAEKPWKEIDALFARLYGLSQVDCELMEDSLFSAAPYRTAGAAAFQPLTPSTVDTFTSCLGETLLPFLAITGRSVVVRSAGFQDFHRASWYFVEVTGDGQPIPMTPELLQQAVAMANELGASRVVVRAESPHGGLLLGQIAQRRWWTKTRARLSATHIVHQHLDAMRPPLPSA